MNVEALLVPEESSSNREGKEEMVAVPPRYRIEQLLGAGGMADVYLCTMHSGESFSRSVAVKVVREAFAKDPTFCGMFVEEARIASDLRHANIVHVEYFGSDMRGRPFLAMEYVDGCELAAVMRAGPLPCSLAIFVASEVLRALGHAHEAPQPNGRKGIVHRDVSPQNILLSKDGSVKLADFGIAKALTYSSQSSIKGKASYMSPEQMRGHRVDGRSDLFAVGIVLWEMLTGERLFAGSTWHESGALVWHKPVPSPSQRLPVPEDLSRATLKLLAKNPADRYARAEDALADLLRCADAPRDGHGELTALLKDGLSSLRRPPQAEYVTASDPAPLEGSFDDVREEEGPASASRTGEEHPSFLDVSASTWGDSSADARGEASEVASPTRDENLSSVAPPAELSPSGGLPARRRIRGRLLIAALAVAAVVALLLIASRPEEPSAGPLPTTTSRSAPSPVSTAPAAGIAPYAAAATPEPAPVAAPTDPAVQAPEQTHRLRSTAKKPSRAPRPAPESSGIIRGHLKDGVPET